MVQKKGVLTSSLKCGGLYSFCRFIMCNIILKVLRSYTVKTLVKSCLTPQFTNLFDHATFFWVFLERKDGCWSTDTPVTRPETSQLKYCKYYLKFLKCQYHIMDQIQMIIFLDRKTQLLMAYSKNQNKCVWSNGEGGVPH